MTTDRELLELAAKAAGFGEQQGHCWTQSEYPKGSGNSGALWNYFGHQDTAELWNPLTDDGDALRLAVKLTLEIDVCRTGIAVRTPNGIKVLVEAEDNPDAYSATRRAIVRAAAAIGETL